ncbi:unnamed protein product [Dracunculus medinensis]|uniref:Deoxyribonuclease TATDN1 n=1 Tax=Dracunculus medinensis TaxID=318479 RepID=A0A3P7PFV6_DRAME|nr:unnamed protein product [Dracunculus medinensis]
MFENDFGDVVVRAKQAGLQKIIVTGTNLEISEKAKNLASLHPGFLYFTAGIHPHDAKTFDENSYYALEQLCADQRCVAVGECGLDYNRNFSTPDVQKVVFEKQVKLACSIKKPLFVHQRDAHVDVLNILAKFKETLPPTVIHCFTGTSNEAVDCINNGYYIGLTGFLWKDRSENGVKNALMNRKIPLDRLVLETDSPFMYPKINDKNIPKNIKDRISSHSRKLHQFSSFNRNEPSALAAICDLVAAYLDEDPIKVAQITSENARNIFFLNKVK